MNLSATMPTKLSLWSRDQIFGGAFLLAVVVLIGGIIYHTMSWMTDEQRLPLSRLVVQGELHHISPVDVQQKLASIEHIGTFMTQDVDQLQQRLLTLPWVAQVSIRKQWPDLVKVYIVEHQASAVWNGNLLLNQTGQVFAGDPAETDDNIVKLYGPEGSNSKVLKVWRQSNQLIKSIGRRISSLVLNDRQAWQIILDNGIRLELGKDSREERLQRFIMLYRHLGEKAEQVSYIDLRYDTGAAVGWISDDELAQERNE